MGADLATAAQVLAQRPAWIPDYNGMAPHSALGYQSPQQYRQAQSLAGEISAPKVPHEMGY